MGVENAGTIPGSGSGFGQPANGTQAQPDYWVTPQQGMLDDSQQVQQQQAQQQPQQSQVDLNQYGLGKFQDVGKLAEGYRNLEAAYTQANQERQRMQMQMEQISAQQAMFQQQTQQSQVQQQNQPISDWKNLAPGDLIDRINQNPHGTLSQIVSQEAQRIAEQMVAPLQKELGQLKGQAEIHFQSFNGFQTEAMYHNLKGTYGGRDPNFDANMQAAAQFLLTPQGEAFLARNPANALETAYKVQLANNITDQNWLNQLSQNMLKQQQQTTQQMSTVNPMVSSPNMQMAGHQPLNPMGGQQMQNRADIAKNIAAFGEAYGLPNFNVI